MNESTRKVWRFDRLISEHAFDKLRSIDCTFGEFEVLLEAAEIVESVEVAAGETKELLLILEEKRRPLHVVVLVDEIRAEERVLTIYEPDPGQWTPDYRKRKR
jgi:hypothetical protein